VTAGRPAAGGAHRPAADGAHRPAADGVHEVAADGVYRLRVPVRFRDLDPMGHAHHTLPLVYLEEARAAFWREVSGTSELAAIDYVMAEITLRFHARILYPAHVDVLLTVGDVGTKSFRIDFEVRSDDGVLLSSGSAVQVAFDYATSAAKPITDGNRAALQAWRAAHEKNIAMVADTMPISPPST
jgi:acyl-CoA thioester hydrolase